MVASENGERLLSEGVSDGESKKFVCGGENGGVLSVEGLCGGDEC